jgi:hypothetical protein
MDNAKEFKSHAFEDYCIATGINLTYYVPYEHAQNELAEAFIKKIQLVARPLLLHAKCHPAYGDMLSYMQLHYLNYDLPCSTLKLHMNFYPGDPLMSLTFVCLDVRCGSHYLNPACTLLAHIAKKEST